MDKSKIIRQIEDLTQVPGFIYSLSFLLLKDFFLNPEESADINWNETLSFQEVSFLIGLMVKHKIDLSIIPITKELNHQIVKIYGLFQKLHEAYNQPFLKELYKRLDKKIDSEESEKSYQDFFSSGAFISEPIFYGNSGAYDFQYWDFALKKYKDDEDWLQKNVGISISTMVEISKKIKKFIEDKFYILKEAKTFEDFCKASLSVFCFNYEDLNFLDKEIVEKFIIVFSVIPGIVNQNLDSVGTYNSIDSHPIIIINDNNYFLPTSFNLARSIYESPFYWMNEDEQYRDIAFKHRGETTEIIAFKLLENVFGKSNVFKNVGVYNSKKELITDVDVLAVAGNKAVIIQAKSKKLTELSRKGDDKSLKEDFKQAVQKAYAQGLISRNAIINKTNKLILENGKEFQLLEFIEDAYIICLTSDHYPAITQQTDVYLDKKDKDPYPLAMSIFDLDVVAFYLKDPFDLLYYFRQRVLSSKYFYSMSEISLLGYHLNQKLFMSPNVKKEFIDEKFAQLIDANFPVMRGYHPVTSAVEKLHYKWKNDKFQLLIEQIKNTGLPGLTDALFLLYDLSGEGADNFIHAIEQTKQKTLMDNQMHDFSIILENGKIGVSFISLADSQKILEKRLMSLCIAKKYKTKTDIWLGLGSIAGSSNIINEIVFNKQPWTKNENLEEFSKIVLKTGIPVNKEFKKVGRNDPCPCGSGKKFKKCCGR